MRYTGGTKVHRRGIQVHMGVHRGGTQVNIQQKTFQGQHLIEEEISQISNPLLLLLPGTALEHVLGLLVVREFKSQGLICEFFSHRQFIQLQQELSEIAQLPVVVVQPTRPYSKVHLRTVHLVHEASFGGLHLLSNHHGLLKEEHSLLFFSDHPFHMDQVSLSPDLTELLDSTLL